MNLLNICDNSDVLDVIRIARIAINIICYSVPVLLTIFISTQILTALVKKDFDLAKDVLKSSVKKLIAGALILLVPTFVKLIVRISVGDEAYYECLSSATSENVSNARISEADDLVSKAEAKLTSSSYASALEKVNKLSDGTQKNELLKRLENVNSVLSVEKLVSAAELMPTKEKYEEALKAVNALSDSDMKEDLLDRLKEVKKSLAASGGNYNPDDQKYNGLQFLSGKSLSEVLTQNGSSIQELNESILNAVESNGVGTRGAVVAAGMTLIDTLAEYGFKINYYWGGKWAKIGARSNWGAYAGSSPYCDSHSNPDYCRSSSIYYGLDCSGFVWWCIVNGFQDTSLKQQNTGVKSSDISLAGQGSAVCQVGDALVNGGHIVLVVGLDDENQRYVIAESSNGVAIGTKSYSQSGYYCRKLNSLYGD